MRRAPRLLIAAASLAVLGLVAACGGDDEATEASGEAAPASGGGLASGGVAAEIQTLEAVVPGGDGGEFSFTATPDLVAGPVEISLTNHGALEHQAMVMRFKPGADFGQFAAAAASDPSGTSALALVEGFGGPNAAAPGETRATTQVLEAGDYMLICVLPDQDGAPHAAHGMVLPFTVAEADTTVDATTATGIEADHEVRLVDFGFVYEGTLSAGETIHVVNEGDQAHELVAYRLDEGATADDFAAAMASPGSGPPPASGGVGIGMLDPGRAVDLALPDDPGEYVLFCMLPDVAGDALPHIAHGMLSPATIA
jgi:plastocyanin